MKRLHVLSRVFAVVTLMTAFLCASAGSASAAWWDDLNDLLNPTITITFDSDGGTYVAPIKQKAYTRVTAPPAPTKEGYTFDGWKQVSWYPKYDSLPTQMPWYDTEFKAQWKINQYTITFDSNGGSAVGPIKKDFGAAVTAPPASTKEGYTFAGWEPELPKTMPAKNMTVKAKWTANQYKIMFDTDGGSKVDPITKDYGADVTAPEAPTKEGYTFDGWEGLPETMPAENITVKAKWTTNQYTITFDTDGGSVVDPITKDFGATVTAPTAPTKEGFSFAGWDTEIPAVMPAKNMTIKAKWTANPTITFDVDGGSEIDPITLAGGQKLYEPTNLEKIGYAFDGWLNEKGEEVEFPTTMPETGMKLKAKWKPIAYSIWLDLGGGEFVSVSGPESYTIESDTFKLPIPTREGYKFIGWTATPIEKLKLRTALKNSGEQEPQMTVEIPKGSFGDMAFTANWEENPAGAESLSGSVGSYDLPETGDSMNILLWGAALAVSVCLLGIMARRKNEA